MNGSTLSELDVAVMLVLLIVVFKGGVALDRMRKPLNFCIPCELS